MSQNQESQQQTNIQQFSSPLESLTRPNSSKISSENVSLFACTKCNSRHRFEELSRRHQLCKTCKASFKVINCDYCCGEFKLEDVDDVKSKICKKCHLLEIQHGQPNHCSCCSLRAAFIGSKCQRCNNSEKKYGAPLDCEQCMKKCAFERPDPESRTKVGGKLLCWSCTMSYKRSQARERYRQDNEILKSLSRHSKHQSSSKKSTNNDTKETSSSTLHRQSRHNQRHHSRKLSPDNTTNGVNYSSNSTRIQQYQNHNNNNNNGINNNTNHHQHSSSTQPRDSANPSSNGYPSNNKKPRVEHRSSHLMNGSGHLTSVTHISNLSETRFSEHNGTDLTSTIGQLKDEMASLNKRLTQKERELLLKDQQIADLKSTATREQKELREKITSLQKQHNERISEMQFKLLSMQKQIASQSKAARNNNSTVSSAYIEPPIVI